MAGPVFKPGLYEQSPFKHLLSLKELGGNSGILSPLPHSPVKETEGSSEWKPFAQVTLVADGCQNSELAAQFS